MNAMRAGLAQAEQTAKAIAEVARLEGLAKRAEPMVDSLRALTDDDRTVTRCCQWLADLRAGTYLYSTIDDPVWYEIDLATTDFATSRSVPLTKDGTFTSLTI